MRTTITRALVIACAAVAPLLTTATARAADFDAGIRLNGEASMHDIGLPSYPGAVAQSDHAGDKSALSFGLWGGAFGLQLQVRKFASTDDADTVAAFYRKAMTRYGEVLDCSQAPPKPAKNSGAAKPDDKALSCDEGERKPGKRVYKVGSDSKNFRVVSLQAVETGVHFQVLRVAIKGD